MTEFQVEPGSVYVHGSKGEQAVNVKGLPMEAFSALLDILAKMKIGETTLARNATPDDGLGPGVWYVLEPEEPEETDANPLG